MLKKGGRRLEYKFYPCAIFEQIKQLVATSSTAPGCLMTNFNLLVGKTQKQRDYFDFELIILVLKTMFCDS